MDNLRFAGRYVRRYWAAYLGGIITLFVVDLMNVYIPQYTGDITDGLEAQTITMGGVWDLILRILLMSAVMAIGRFFWRFFLNGCSRSIERDIRDDLFAHIETLSNRYFTEHKTGDLMAHFTNDLGAVRSLLGPMVVTAFDASVMLVMVLWKMTMYVNIKLTIVAVLPLVAIIIGDCAYGKVMHRRFLEKQEAFSTLTDEVQETVSGIRVIKSFVQEHRELAAFAKTNLLTKDKNLGVVRLQALFIPILDLIIGVSGLLTLIYGGRLCIYGEITLGQFVAFNTYINMLVWPMIAVGDCITYISQGFASIKRLRDIFDTKPDIVDSPTANVEKLDGNIEINNLTFTYPNAPVPALENISVTVKAGETLAIIGRTGCGKTTLADLLLRVHNTDEGAIKFDGNSIYDVPLSVLRRDIAYVPQDSFLFSDTIENNIDFGALKKDHDGVVKAAEDACIHDNIIEFPDGYDTLVGERGVTLSGGQKQRTSIARALLKDSPILILDDALSAVDTDTEERILTNLRENRAGKTTIIIAHRISTIEDADHILVLDDGKMIQYGTHDELMAVEGVYRSVYEKQQLEKQLAEEEDEQ